MRLLQSGKVNWQEQNITGNVIDVIDLHASLMQRVVLTHMPILAT